MEVRQLEGFVLLLVMLGMIIGVGVLVLDKFGDAVQDDTTVTNETVTITANVGQLANDEIVSIQSIGNKTTVMTNWVDTGINWTESGGISFNNTAGELYFNYTYEADSTATTAVGNVNTSIGTIATTWLPLVVTIVILSIILTLVIRSFVIKKR